MRGVKFGDYVLKLLISPTKRMEETSRVTVEDMNIAITKLGDTSSLGETNLAKKLNISGSDLRNKIQYILSLNPPPAPLNTRKQALLQQLYDEPSIYVEKVLEKLHISRSTYYRDRREAMENLIELLCT